MWLPHVTVAAVIPRDNKFLIVEEHAKDNPSISVFNQPAGHLEENETLIEALEREAYEETGWKVKADAFLGLRIFKAPNNTTYVRANILALPIEHDPSAVLDADIIRTHWMSTEDLQKNAEKLRSPLVLDAVSIYNSGTRYPLSSIELGC